MAAPIVAAAAKALATTFAAEPEKGLKVIMGAIMLPLCLVVMLFSAIPGAQQTVPNITSNDFDAYKSVCDDKADEIARDIFYQDPNNSDLDQKVQQEQITDLKYRYLIEFKYLMAIDAVRYEQDFSKASSGSIRKLLDMFYEVKQVKKTFTVKHKDSETGEVTYEEIEKMCNEYTKKSYSEVCSDLRDKGISIQTSEVDKFLMFDINSFFADGEFKYNNDPMLFDVPVDIKINPSEVSARVPYFSQFDSRWGQLAYGGASMANSACGPTSMAMVIDALHGYSANIDTNKDNIIDPYEAACYSVRNGHRITGLGTDWGYFADIGAACGLKVSQYEPNQWRTIKNALEGGNLVIASMGPGEFTRAGHFIVLRGVNDEGKILVNDPASESRTRKAYDFISPVLSQARQFWIIKK